MPSPIQERLSFEEIHSSLDDLKKESSEDVPLIPFVLGVVCTILVLGLLGYYMAEKDTCTSYSSQIAAQVAFDSNPSRYSKLDRNNNGKACETYNYGTTIKVKIN